MKQILKILYLFVFCSLLGFEGSLFAQLNAPKNLRAKPTDDNRILLEWEKPDAFKVTSYYIYRACNPDTIGFIHVASVPGNMLYYLDDGLKKGEKYNYYISAVSGYEGSGKSNMASAPAIQGAGYISFITLPRTQAQVANGFLDAVIASSTNTNAKIEYELITKPEGMTLLNSNGWKISWNPPASGRYDVSVLAKYTNDSLYQKYGIITKTIQKYTIQVAGKIGNISGTVTDESGKFVSNVVLKFYQANDQCFSYETTTDDFGAYNLKDISTGSYYVYMKAPEGYVSTWYPSTPEMKSGSLVQITENSQVKQSFTIKNDRINTAYIKGIVKDTFNNPIANISVIAINAQDYLNIGKDDKSLDNYIDELRNDYSFYSDLTEVSGEFSIEVPKGKQYFVYCQSDGYSTAYYPNTSDLLSAAKLNVDGNKEGINFYLLSKKASQNKIDGKVIRTDIGTGIESRVILINKSAQRGGQGGGRIPFRSADVFTSIPSACIVTIKTDKSGTFVMDNIDTSRYYVQAVPVGNFLPSYYAPNYSNGTIDWKNADSINMAGAVTGLVVKSMPSICDGVGSISGTIKSYDSQQYTGIGGAIVYALSDGVPFAYGITDSLGNYLIKGLRVGKYTLYVDLIGYKITSSSEFTISFPNVNIENANITLLSPIMDVNSKDINTIPLGYNLSQNFPNPFNPSTTIKYVLAKRSMVELKVFDVLGREVAVLFRGMKDAGGYQMMFDGSNMASGLYFVTLKVDEGAKTVYFDKRKMLLIK
jgi:hypothetical protein